MPEMDGFDVLDWMRTNNQTRCVPVVILSNKMLTTDDVKRLESHAFVTVQSKGILSKSEIIVSLHRALFGTDVLTQHTSALVKHAIAFLHQNYQQPFSRWEVAEAVGASEYYLSRVFHQDLGLSPWEYLKRLRIFHAKALLLESNKGIKAVARQVGINDPAYFSRVFRQETGFSPSAYRKNSPK